MNAKELHDLYAPLHAAVPETRPAMDWFVSLATARRFVPVPVTELEAQSWAERGTAGTIEAAAALCRVAAEDWLVHHADLECFEIHRNDASSADPPLDVPASAWADLGGYMVSITWRREPENFETMQLDEWCESDAWSRAPQTVTIHHRPTIHHALVAACLAVHSSSPSSAPSPHPPHPPA